MTVEPSFLCETCGGEFPVSELDGGPDGRGTFCLDCGCEACGEAMYAAELAALLARMPAWGSLTGAEPGIAVEEDDFRYDGEGRQVEEAAARAAGNYAAPDREGELSPSKLSDDAREALSLLTARDWSLWTPAEVYWAAHLHPSRLGQAGARAVQAAITRAGGAAMIPHEYRVDVIDAFSCG
jgi:hypothetical protein